MVDQVKHKAVIRFTPTCTCGWKGLEEAKADLAVLAWAKHATKHRRARARNTPPEQEA